MSTNGKKRAIEKANILLEAKAIQGSNIIKESSGPQVGTPIVTIKGKMKGTIVGIHYVTELSNGEVVMLKEGDFYNDSEFIISYENI